MIKKRLVENLQLEGCDWYISDFEAFEENEHRIKVLRKVADEIYLNPYRRYTNADLHNLADKLELCNAGEMECKSLACKRCNRAFQIKRVNKITNAMVADQRRDSKISYCMITIVQYSRSLEAYDFVGYDIQGDKDRIRQLLRGCKVKGPVIGSFELDFHRTPQRWLTHYHLSARLTGNEDALGKMAARIQKLHPNHIKPHVTARPFLVQSLEDPLKQVSYMNKLACFEVRDYKSVCGKRRTKKFRLDKLLFCESLCWLDEKGRRKLLFEHHARDWLKHSEF